MCKELFSIFIYAVSLLVIGLLSVMLDVYARLVILFSECQIGYFFTKSFNNLSLSFSLLLSLSLFFSLSSSLSIISFYLSFFPSYCVSMDVFGLVLVLFLNIFSRDISPQTIPFFCVCNLILSIYVVKNLRLTS